MEMAPCDQRLLFLKFDCDLCLKIGSDVEKYQSLAKEISEKRQLKRE